jgi:hypothetical protein
MGSFPSNTRRFRTSQGRPPLTDTVEKVHCCHSLRNIQSFSATQQEIYFAHAASGASIFRKI